MKRAFILFPAVLVVLSLLLMANNGTAFSDDCITWVCEYDDITKTWNCYWYIPPGCPGQPTPVPLPTYIATMVATPGDYPIALPPTDPLVQPCKVDGYAYDELTSCLTCVDSPYPNVAGATVCQACQSVTRQPYPRGMVDVENRFRVYGPTIAEASVQVCATKDDCLDDINVNGVRDVKYYLRWVRADDQIPIWGWDERRWNVVNHQSPDTGYGWQAIHTYKTSSYSLTGDCYETDPNCDKPRNGPSLAKGEYLPAYQVKVLTPWYAQYRVTYQTLRHWSACVWSLHVLDCCSTSDPDLDSECTRSVHEPPRPGDHGCKVDFRDCVQAGKADSYDDPICWTDHDTGWQAIDARIFGSDYPFAYGSRAGNEETDLEGARCNVVPVPIIEVQGVLDQH